MHSGTVNPSPPRVLDAVTRRDRWLWAGTAVTLVVAAVPHYGTASSITQFLTALVAIALAAAVLGRAVNELGGRISPSAVGLFNAVTGNIPELIIGILALRHHLDAIVQATILGSMLNMLLFSNGLAFMAGGLRHGSLPINTQRAQNASVMLVLMTAVLTAPAVAVSLRTPAAQHTQVISVVAAIALLVVFVIALPRAIRGVNDNGNGAGVEPRPAPTAAPGGWPVSLALTVLAVTGLLIAFEADWLTSALQPAIDTLHLNAGFTGLFLIATVGNLSQIGPSVQLALQRDADTATEINLEGALQVTLMLGPLFVLVAPLVGDTTFTLIFSPLAVVAVILAALLVVFVIIDGEVNYLEGVMLTALYAVLGSLFWWT